MTIRNGSDITLDQSTGNLPQMSSTMSGWMRPITFIRIVKTIVNHRAVEAETNFSFSGVWQPLNPKQVSIKPVGQRTWAWFMLHCDISIILEPDEVVTYLGTRYRVRAHTHYKEYGYIEYHLSEDYL